MTHEEESDAPDQLTALISDWKEHYNLTIEEMAARSELSTQTISRWLRHATAPKTTDLIKLIKRGFGVSLLEYVRGPLGAGDETRASETRNAWVVKHASITFPVFNWDAEHQESTQVDNMIIELKRVPHARVQGYVILDDGMEPIYAKDGFVLADHSSTALRTLQNGAVYVVSPGEGSPYLIRRVRKHKKECALVADNPRWVPTEEPTPCHEMIILGRVFRTWSDAR